MRLLERFRNESTQPQNASPTGAGDQLTELRQAAEELLAAGADAINRTLSKNSDAYLSATQQHGGQ